MIAQQLREFRARQGFSQRQLAEALGLPVRTIQEWEQGRRPGPGNRLIELALIGLQLQCEQIRQAIKQLEVSAHVSDPD